ncbi:hypothetical protein QAD02_006191 [Eretmocerus hayati]|uniref:Uncharacterized protein n=1 Tax=Eretmocerus hayati TaxID=131215 RepID=A0ACC2N0J2_9HYME|nr:hypothetical protein QAD02_006191 [Eretmocerus hayati]
MYLLQVFLMMSTVLIKTMSRYFSPITLSISGARNSRCNKRDCNPCQDQESQDSHQKPSPTLKDSDSPMSPERVLRQLFRLYYSRDPVRLRSRSDLALSCALSHSSEVRYEVERQRMCLQGSRKKAQINRDANDDLEPPFLIRFLELCDYGGQVGFGYCPYHGSCESCGRDLAVYRRCHRCLLAYKNFGGEAEVFPRAFECSSSRHALALDSVTLCNECANVSSPDISVHIDDWDEGPYYRLFSQFKSDVI